MLSAAPSHAPAVHWDAKQLPVEHAVSRSLSSAERHIMPLPVMRKERPPPLLPSTAVTPSKPESEVSKGFPVIITAPGSAPTTSCRP